MKHRTSLPPRASSALRQLALLVATALSVITLSLPAWAVGRVEWKSTTFEERTSTKSWHLELKIFLPKAPDVAHVPMRFEFEPIAYYDRSLVDGDKLVEQRLPLEHRQALIESVDVGFMDPGSGQTQSRTKFSFKVTRAHGYEAGEYKVTIRDSRTGQTIGTPTTLKFQGENEIIDRRTMVFTGKKKAKDKEPEKTEAAEEKSEPEEASEPADEPAEDEADEDDTGSAPPPVEGKPGGCGCHHGPSHGEPLAWLAAGALVAGFVMRRRELLRRQAQG